jgi:hypothetical protein
VTRNSNRRQQKARVKAGLLKLDHTSGATAWSQATKAQLEEAGKTKLYFALNSKSEECCTEYHATEKEAAEHGNQRWPFTCFDVYHFNAAAEQGYHVMQYDYRVQGLYGFLT